MAGNRTVKVSLQAEVANYISGMEKAASKTRETGSEAEKLAQKKEAFETLGRTSMVMGAAIAAGVGLAIAKYADFEQAMSNVQAATHASAEDQKALSDAAIAAGASTVFSATESANAIEELSKAGLETADILGGALTGSLDLASAGQLGVARAAEISSTALQQFNLDGDQAGHVADVLAAGAGKAMGSVEDLANGLKFVGPVANSMGISLEETTGVLAMFAQQGIIGEQAGTSLRGVIASLTSPSGIARKEIEKLGLQIYDSNGKFLGLENAAGELSKAYSGMDDASRQASMGIIFGRETITAATSLYQGGAEGVAEWTAAVDDSGYASETAAARLDNLKGDVEALGGAFDTALIQTGAAGNDVLRFMAQGLTNLIDLYNGAPEPLKIATLAIAGVTAAALLAGGAFLIGAPKVAAFNAALATMGPNAQRAGAALTAAAGPIGLAFTVAAGALAVFAGQQAAAKAMSAEFVDTLDDGTGAVTRYTRELVAKKLAESGAFEAAKEAGVGQKELTEAVLEGGKALDEVNDKIGDNNTIGNFFTGVGIRAGNAKDAIKGVADGVKQSAKDFEDQKAALEGSKEATEASTDASELNAAALESLAAEADSSEESITDLADTIRGFADETLDARSAARDLEAAYDALTESIKANGTSLDIGTEKGRANQAAIDAIAQSAKASSAATLEQTGSQEQANAVLQAGRDRLIAMLEPFGIVGDAANAYADELGLIPTTKETALKLDADAAKLALDQFLYKLNNIPSFKAVVIEQQIKQTGAPRGEVGAAYNANGSIMDFYADGGMRENHVAQIAPAGAWRVWAEPETGGEAYIPLATSKRARSLDIWAETGKRLGAQNYASGGMYAVNSGGGVTSVSVTPDVHVTLSPKGGVDILKYVDVQIEQAGKQRQMAAENGSRRL